MVPGLGLPHLGPNGPDVLVGGVVSRVVTGVSVGESTRLHRTAGWPAPRKASRSVEAGERRPSRGRSAAHSGAGEQVSVREAWRGFWAEAHDEQAGHENDHARPAQGGESLVQNDEGEKGRDGWLEQ